MSTTVVLDTQAIHEAFRAWQREEESLHAQLAESLAALEAYQAHLDAWHSQLARERDELWREREALDRERAGAASAPLELGLPATTPPVPAPAAANGRAGAEPGGPPSAGLASQTVPEKPANRCQRPGANPVLGSIVEQFGKLRQQRALDRQLARQR